MTKKEVSFIVSGVVGVIVVLLLFLSFSFVPANTVGIKYSAFGGVSEKTLNEGVHLVTPFVDRIYKIETTVQSVSLHDMVGQTKDSQYLNFHLDVKYKVNREKAFNVFKTYTSLDKVNSSLITRLTQRALETITSQYDVIDILGERRNEVYSKIDEEIEKSLVENNLEFVSFTIVDADAGEEIENAIKRESVAKKEVEVAKQNLEKEKIEAEIKKTKAQAEADANAILSEKIDDKILKKMEMEARLKHGWITVQGSGQVITQNP